VYGNDLNRENSYYRIMKIAMAKVMGRNWVYPIPNIPVISSIFEHIEIIGLPFAALRTKFEGRN
jgi:hypothetical protein